ncbi:MAG: peptidylprolyl isomerase [Halioglobus sp.]
MTFLSRLNKPWLHFIVMGLLLYKIQGALFPEPRPVIGPLNPARLEALSQQWLSATGQLPTAEQKQRLVSTELDRDMLFQRAVALELHLYDTVVQQRLVRNIQFLQLAEGKTQAQMYDLALEMRLHLGDEVVKRRLIQVMEQLLLAQNPPQAPGEQALQEEFEQRAQELRRPARYSLEHIYFNREREPDVESIVEKINEEGLDPSQARQLSSPFLPGYVFQRQSPGQLARHFGASFVSNLLSASPQAESWTGPVRSTYGLHYVWISDIEPERDAQLAEVRTQLLRDLESRARDTALRSSIETMRAEYEVIQ